MGRRIRFWTLAALLAAGGCGRLGCGEPPAPAPVPPKLAREPAPDLSADERAMADAMAALHKDLARAMESAPARIPKLAVVEPAMQAALRPHYERVAALTPKYRALPKERRKAVQRAFHKENEAALVAFVKAVGAWTYSFDHDDLEVAREFRPLMRNLLGPWAREDLFWVFEGWSEEAVLELTEWTLGEDEMRDLFRRKLARREWEHAAVVLEGKPFAVTGETNCLQCHAEGEEDRRGEEDER